MNDQYARSRRLRFVGLIAAFSLLGLGIQVAAQADGVTGRAALKDASGNPVGVVRLSQEEDGVLVRAIAESLQAGFHGFVCHER